MTIFAAVTDEAFVPHCATMVASLAHHNPGCQVIIFGDELTKHSEDRLQSFARGAGIDLSIVNVEKLLLDQLPTKSPYSRAVWAKVFMPDFVGSETEKFVYIDSDTLVLDSLDPLFDFPTADMPLGAVADPQSEALCVHKRSLGMPSNSTYYNAGVMLINASAWRHALLSRRIVHFALNYKTALRWLDQCAINAVAWNNIVPLPRKWNYLIAYPDNSIDPVILHFAGPTKPWYKRSIPGEDLYKYYRSQTPWNSYEVPTVYFDGSKSARQFAWRETKRHLYRVVGFKKGSKKYARFHQFIAERKKLRSLYERIAR